MNDRAETKLQLAERLVRLSESPDGQVFLRGMSNDFDKAMQTLLYDKADTLVASQGYARALHEQLKKFTDAKAEILAAKTKGNT